MNLFSSSIVRTSSPAPFRLIASACLLASCLLAHAQLTTPLHIGAMGEILDEFGRPLEGTANQPGDLVEILRVTGEAVESPDIDGEPTAGNEVIVTTRIGHLAPANKAKPAIFGLSVSGDERPSDGEQIFVRVFNAPDKESATFYGDSKVFSVDFNKEFPVYIEATDKPLDANDDDADGLNNSFEQSMGTNPGAKDTDGDGMMDGAEQRAGTDALDRDSLLAIDRIIPQGADAVVVWDAVPDARYQLEYSADDLTDSPTFTDVGPVVTATDSEAQLLVENGMDTLRGHYRVRLVEDSP